MNTYLFVGIDEVGRGALAGPVTFAAAAAIKIPPELFCLKDSKKYNPVKRKEVYRRLLRHPDIFFTSRSVSNGYIDKFGLSHVSEKAISGILDKIENKLSERAVIFMDGGLFAPAKFRQLTIIRGDAQISLIAAASIIAKVRRDAFMIRKHKMFPKHRFDIHKGYGTVLHKKMIVEHGLSPLHRKSFSY